MSTTLPSLVFQNSAKDSKLLLPTALLADCFIFPIFFIVTVFPVNFVEVTYCLPAI